MNINMTDKIGKKESLTVTLPHFMALKQSVLMSK